MISTFVAVPLALLLPWVLGYMLAKWLIGAGRPWSTHLGYGYLLGMLVVTVAIRGSGASGQSINYWSIVGLLLLLIGIFFALQRLGAKTHQSTVPPPFHQVGDPRPLWQSLTAVVLSLAILAHFAGVIQELLLRPTFPWDAWYSWQPEAIQYFTNKSLDAPVHTNDNYGELTTIILLWMSLASGETHEPLLHLPWLGIYIAIGAVIYGHLREPYGKLWGIVGCYLVLSLPYLNVHAALAGYADIWIALSYTAGILTLRRYLQAPRIGELILFLLMIAACVYTKRAGAGFAIALLGTAAIIWMFHAKTIISLLIGSLVALGWAVISLIISGALEVNIPLPNRSLTFTTGELSVTGLLEFRLSPEWHHEPIIEAMFQYSNWHLVSWYWCALTIAVVARRQWSELVSPESTGIVLGLAVCLLFFYLQPDSALDQTRLSRVLVYVMPLAAAMLVSMVAYSRPSLPPIPDEACHPFHANAATDSTAKLPPWQRA